jgi:cold shock CspA family protein
MCKKDRIAPTGSPEAKCWCITPVSRYISGSLRKKSRSLQHIKIYNQNMARSQETVGKKEKEKKKAKQRQDKAERKEERKANSGKGKSLEDMMAYIDENGNISSTPPDPRKRKEINLEDIQLGATRHEPSEPVELIRRGVVKFFNESKGYGFIIDQQTQDSVFVHINQLTELIKEKDKVTFEVERGQKGPSAVNVRKEVKVQVQQVQQQAPPPPPPQQQPEQQQEQQ